MFSVDTCLRLVCAGETVLRGLMYVQVCHFALRNPEAELDCKTRISRNVKVLQGFL